MSRELTANPTSTPESLQRPHHPRDGRRTERPRAARFAVATLFFVNGALFATWVARIPAIQAQRGLSHGELGLALLALALGAVVAMPLAGRFSASHGSARVCKLAALTFCAMLPLLALATPTALFVASLILFGAAHGAMDVAMNAEAVEVERRYGAPIMSSFHALFSTGGLFGAAVGGGLAAIGLTPIAHFAAFAAVLGAVSLLVFPRLLAGKASVAPPNAAGHSSTARRGLHAPGLIALGLVAASTMMGEGAMADWGAVYLRNIRMTTESVAATGYAAFSIAMAAGRFGGDRLTARFGGVRVVQFGGLLAAVGLTVALLVPGAGATLAGFALVGVGFSGIVPLVFSAAGRIPGIDPGIALATVTTTGYVGFLLGPPLIGFTAEFIGLPGALGLIVATSVLSGALASAVDPKPAHPADAT